MGAAGNFVLCPNGHVIGIIEDDMYWGEPDDKDSLWNRLEELKNSRCRKCGRFAMYNFLHYGSIDDCLHDVKLEFNSKEERYIIPSTVNNNILDYIIKRKEYKGYIHDSKMVSAIIKLLKFKIRLVDGCKIGYVILPTLDEEYLRSILGISFIKILGDDGIKDIMERFKDGNVIMFDDNDCCNVEFPVVSDEFLMGLLGTQ